MARPRSRCRAHPSAVAIADGADSLTDIAAFKEQEELFGPVASVATAWRAVHATAVFELRAIPLALATARARSLRAWSQMTCFDGTLPRPSTSPCATASCT
jgi:hypothetical protein